MYRKPELSKSKWALFIEDAKKILEKADCPLSYSKRVKEDWVNFLGFIADKKLLHFNGIDEDSHETMFIERVHTFNDWENRSDPMVFTFCKTAYKPYDKYVTAIALLASIHFGDDIKNVSDGEQSDWEEGKAVLEETLGIKTEWKTFQDDEGQHVLSVNLVGDKEVLRLEG